MHNGSRLVPRNTLSNPLTIDEVSCFALVVPLCCDELPPTLVAQVYRIETDIGGTTLLHAATLSTRFKARHDAKGRPRSLRVKALRLTHASRKLVTSIGHCLTFDGDAL
jgi:hypothetical protein